MKKGRMPVLACGPFLLALLLGSSDHRSTTSAEENLPLDNAAEMMDSAPGELANIDANALGPAEENVVNTDGSGR
jgi:hypothetical protein